jgi:hypothetical protein
VREEMHAGAVLYLQHTNQGPCWVLSNGRPIPDSVARLVTTSGSVVGMADSLFAGAASQTFRWWCE